MFMLDQWYSVQTFRLFVSKDSATETATSCAIIWGEIGCRVRCVAFCCGMVAIPAAQAPEMVSGRRCSWRFHNSLLVWACSHPMFRGPTYETHALLFPILLSFAFVRPVELTTRPARVRWRSSSSRLVACPVGILASRALICPVATTMTVRAYDGFGEFWSHADNIGCGVGLEKEEKNSDGSIVQVSQTDGPLRTKANALNSLKELWAMSRVQWRQTAQSAERKWACQWPIRP